ncbi:MAG: polysaccharide deacetylase family protein [Acutalibacteraceae bacterium]|nr:polysaccharide deacetylase family protein [Acutalibacteraceae bacterium]
MYFNFKINKGVFTGIFLTAVALCFSVMCSGFVPHTQAVSAKEESVRLPIIMYHSISKDSKQQGKYVIDPSKLENDLITLKEKGYTTITIQQLIDYTENKCDLPDKPIMLTFDDGYYNNYLYAYPLLKKHRCKAVISPICYYTEQYSNANEVLSPSYSHCTWQQLEEMQKSGYVEIQNHSYNLHSQNGRLGIQQRSDESDNEYKEVITKDISQAQDMFKQHLKITPNAFVYPFGIMSDSSEEILKGLSFKCTLICEEKVNTITKDKNSLYMLGRYLRTNDMSANELFEKFG